MKKVNRSTALLESESEYFYGRMLCCSFTNNVWSTSLHSEPWVCIGKKLGRYLFNYI